MRVCVCEKIKEIRGLCNGPNYDRSIAINMMLNR